MKRCASTEHLAAAKNARYMTGSKRPATEPVEHIAQKRCRSPTLFHLENHELWIGINREYKTKEVSYYLILFSI